MNIPKNRKIIATIEARMTSSRLPGKVLLPSLNKPMLQLMVERLENLKHVDDIVIATTVNKIDDPIVELAETLGIKYFRGSEEDVLARVLGAAHENGADVIVELTGDCPLMDPALIDQVIELYFEKDCDYATNCLIPSFPLGMDLEVFSTELLELADREGNTIEDREHVSWFFVRNPERFTLVNLTAPDDLTWPELRLTLDEQADFELIDSVFSHFSTEYQNCSCGEIIDYIRKTPQLLGLNKNVVQRGDWDTIAAQTQDGK